MIEAEIGGPETCTGIALRPTCRAPRFAGYETIEIHMQHKIMISLVGLTMLIGTHALAEGSGQPAVKDAEPRSEASQETDLAEGAVEKAKGTEEGNSSAGMAEGSEIVGDIAVGEELYEDTCKNCHGPKAQGMASFPKLTGHEAEYLVERLTTYRAGEKVGPNTALMAPMAADLSDEDIASLAIYISETFE